MKKLKWHVLSLRDPREIQNFLEKLSNNGVSSDNIKMVSLNVNSIYIYYQHKEYITNI